MKRRWPTIILVLSFFIGLLVLLYPTVSDYINEKNQSKAVEDYNKTLIEMDKELQQQLLEAAKQYNKRLFETENVFYYPDAVEGYDEILDAAGHGVMGYLSIDKIRVELPIYHGTSSSVLNVAVGHLKGTSLPVGGENTHCVLSAHRGLPSAKLFTDLDMLEIGDVFTITVLDEVITYQVDQIRIIRPTEAGDLQLIPGGDYCTLLTCTPYGINTHRLLVRGKRIENLKEKPIIYITADAFQIESIIAAPAVAAPMLLVLLVKLMLPKRKKKKITVSDIIN